MMGRISAILKLAAATPGAEKSVKTLNANYTVYELDREKSPVIYGLIFPHNIFELINRFYIKERLLC